MGLSDQTPVIQGATDGTEIGNNGDSLNVYVTNGNLATYSAAAAGFALATLATDVSTIQGSDTKTIKILRIEAAISTTSGSGGLLTVSLIKRSTANTGGTTTTLTNVPHDSSSSAGTAVVKNYTVNPTLLGTAVGTVRATRTGAFNSGMAPSSLIWDFATRPSEAVVLRGTSEFLCLNLGTVSITGSVATFSIEWTEE